VLGIPADYRIAIVPASDTGAVEMALWSLLGARPVDMLAWESFGEGWVTDVAKQLKLKDARVLKAGYGEIVRPAAVDWTHDVVFTWNGTTSGVRCRTATGSPTTAGPDDLRRHLGGVRAWTCRGEARCRHLVVAEGAGRRGRARHAGAVAARRRAAESYSPPWPMPKIFRLTSGGKFSEAIFKGDTINTPSLLCVEDAIDGLQWARASAGSTA
jgi:phosphoserine aminotransferase